MPEDLKITIMPLKRPTIRATVLPDGRWLLFDEPTRSATTLTPAAGILWELCDGQTPLAEVISEVQDYYPDTPRTELTAQIQDTLTEFSKQGLVCEP